MPDKEFIFLINELDSIYGRPINPPHALLWIIPVSNENINEINFTEFIPQYAQGILVYKIYKLIISKFKYITAIEYQITKMYGIWCGLMADRDLYHFVSIKKSGVIDKKISNSELVICLDKIKHLNAKFDSDLENKIIEFYGNLEFFKSDS